MHPRLLTLQNPSTPERVPKGRVRSLNFFSQVPLAPKRKNIKNALPDEANPEPPLGGWGRLTKNATQGWGRSPDKTE